jgi:hypothetical protein
LRFTRHIVPISRITHSTNATRAVASFDETVVADSEAVIMQKRVMCQTIRVDEDEEEETGHGRRPRLNVGHQVSLCLQDELKRIIAAFPASNALRSNDTSASVA